MPLLSDITKPANTVSGGTFQIRNALKRAVVAAEESCGKVKAQVAFHGIDALQAELGDDAAELATVYAAVRALCQAAGQDPGPLT